MLGNSSFIEYDSQPMEKLPNIIADRLQGMSFSVSNVELRPSRSAGGVMVNITLNKAANLNALFIAATIGNGFIVDAIVSEILTLCKSLSGPVFAGE